MTDREENIRSIPSKIHEITQDNRLLFVIIGLGIVILVMGIAPPYVEMMLALGAAFIIAGAVGVYMMLGTRQVARGLHERFNEQNEILRKLDESSNKQTDILREIASSQKEIASSQKNTTEILKRIEDKL